jgi:hypothetical protein
MNEKITCLEEELERRSNLDRKDKQRKDVLDRQRSQSQTTRLQNMEERHKRQHDVYEEAQRILTEKQQQALKKVQKWDEQVHAVLCDRENSHRIRKDMQQVASRAMESLNDKIYQQKVQSKINTEELRDHMTRCLSHKSFDSIPKEHVPDRMVSSTCALRSSRSEQALHSSRSDHALNAACFENVTPTPGKARAKSPQYQYRPISALIAKPPPRCSDRYLCMSTGDQEKGLGRVPRLFSHTCTLHFQ